MPTKWEVDSVKPTAPPPPPPPPQQGAPQQGAPQQGAPQQWEVDSVTPTAAASGQGGGLWDKVKEHAAVAGHELSDLNTGFTSALSQTGHTAEQAINAIPGVGPMFQKATATAQNEDQQRASMKLNTTQHMGAAIENILEFAAGDEALKGASFLAKSESLRPLMDALKKSPQSVQIIGNLIAQGSKGAAMSAAQTALHGGDATAVKHAAEIGGVVGAAAEPLTQGVTKLVQSIKPSSVVALGETLPQLASQKPGAVPLAKSVANITTEPAISGEQQLGAQKGLINRAREVTERELENLNAARQARWKAGQKDINLAPEPQTPVAGADRQLPSGQSQLPAATASDAPQLAADVGGPAQLPAGETAPQTGLAPNTQVGQYEGEFPAQPGAQPGQVQPPAATPAQPAAAGATPGSQRVSYIEEQPPNFQPIDAKAEAAGVASFGDAAEKIREHAGPVFKTFNEASGGEYTRLRAIRDEAYSASDYKTVSQAEKAIDALFEDPKVAGKLDRTDYKAVKSAWRSSKLLDAVHDAVNRGFNIGDAKLAEDAGVWRGISGAKLLGGVNRLLKDYGRDAIDQILGPDGMSSLTRIGSLLQTPKFAQQYGQVIGDVADDIAAHAASAGGSIPKTVQWARNLLLHRIATDPQYAKFVEYAAKNRIPQKTATAILVTLLNQGGSKREGFKPKIEDKQVVAPDASRGVQPVTMPTLTSRQQRLATAASLGGGDDSVDTSTEPDDTTAPEE